MFLDLEKKPILNVATTQDMNSGAAGSKSHICCSLPQNLSSQSPVKRQKTL